MGLISNGTTVFDAGSMASGFGGSMTFIKKLTASSSATLSFVDGSDGVVLDNTYKEYLFTFNNIHPSQDGSTFFSFNMSVDSGSNYNVAKTTTDFYAYHKEDASDSGITYGGGYGNTTSAVNAVRFNMESGNIASGTIKLYGVK